MNNKFLYIMLILATLFADIYDLIFGSRFFYSTTQIIFINVTYLLLPFIALILINNEEIRLLRNKLQKKEKKKQTAKSKEIGQ